MKRLVRFAPLLLATASLVGCGSTLTSSNASPAQNGKSESTFTTLLLTVGPQQWATYNLQKDQAQLLQSGSLAPSPFVPSYSGSDSLISVPSQKAILSRQSGCDRYGCVTSLSKFAVENGVLKALDSSWISGNSFGITGSGRFAVAADDYYYSLQTYSVQESSPFLQSKGALTGFGYAAADPSSDFMAAIAYSGTPGTFGHGTLTLFKLDENGTPLSLVNTRVEPGFMTWSRDLIFIVNQNGGPNASPGYAVSAVHVVRDQGNLALEAHPGNFWFIGDSPQITLSPTNDYMVAGSESPGLYVYKLDPQNGAILNWPGVPLAGYDGDLNVAFDRDNTLVVAASDSTSNETKLYRLTLSASGEILNSQFLGSHEGQTTALVLLDSSFDRTSN